MKAWKSKLAFCALALLSFGAQAASALELKALGVYNHGAFQRSASEIAAFDVPSKRLFVVNGEKNRIDVLDLSNPAAPAFVGAFDLSKFGSTPNSVAVRNGVGVAAVTGKKAQGPGAAVFFKTADLSILAQYETGPMPDMVGWSPDGKYVVTANEGEPDVRYKKDPEGSVTILDVSGGVVGAKPVQAGFSAFKWADLKGVVPVKKGQSFAQDAEPEYVAFAADGKTAYVGLQEVNAIGVIDLAAGKIVSVTGLGFKDWSKSALDTSDRDGGIFIEARPVFGIYQPDSIAAFRGPDGKTYIVSANEGDSKDFSESGGSYNNESRLEDVSVDSKSKLKDLQGQSALGRLKIINTIGDDDNDGDFDRAFALGARSISIWDASDISIVYDSGDVLERTTARIHGPNGFNANHNDNAYDNRSDDKGPEPEGVAIGQVGGRTIAFVGLERVSGIAMFDVTDPKAANLVAYHNQRDFNKAPALDKTGDLGPEGLLFIPADQAPGGKALLVVCNEVSSTTRIYEVIP